MWWNKKKEEEKKLHAPQRTWAMFKRNVLFTLNWPYLISYIGSLAMTFATLTYTSEAMIKLEDENPRLAKNTDDLIFLVLLGLPFPAVAWTYFQMKKTGYRHAKSEDGSGLLQWLLFVPLGLLSFDRTRDWLPFWSPFIVYPWSILALHLSEMWFSMYSAGDFNFVSLQQKMENDEILAKEEVQKKRALQYPLEWVVFKQHIVKILSRPLELILMCLSLSAPIIASQLEGSEGPIFNFINERFWAPLLIVALVLGPGYVIMFLVPSRIRNSLEAAGYKDSRTYVRAVEFVLLFVVFKPLSAIIMSSISLRYMPFSPLTVVAGQVWSIWLGKYYLAADGKDMLRNHGHLEDQIQATLDSRDSDSRKQTNEKTV